MSVNLQLSGAAWHPSWTGCKVRSLISCFSVAGVVLLVLAASPTAAVSADVLVAAPDEPIVSVVDALEETAAERGLSYAELTDQMAWENTFAVAATELATLYPDDFAGAEVSDGVPIVRFSQIAPSGAVKALLAVGPKVKIVENHGWSEAAIAAAGEEAHHAVRASLNSEVATSADVATGVISVYVPEGAEVIAERAVDVRSATLRAAGNPFTVEVEADAGLSIGSDVVYGGAALSTCTAGFSVSKAGYLNAIITADHCPNSQKFGTTSLPYQAGSTTRDVQWHSSSLFAAPQIRWGVNSVYIVSGKANPVVGQTLCRHGKTTGFDCSTTYIANQCRASYCGMMTMTNREADGGDSGGPWFSGSVAYGVHSGWVTIWGTPRDMFTPINLSLSTFGLTLKL